MSRYYNSATVELASRTGTYDLIRFELEFELELDENSRTYLPVPDLFQTQIRQEQVLLRLDLDAAAEPNTKALFRLVDAEAVDSPSRSILLIMSFKLTNDRDDRSTVGANYRYFYRSPTLGYPKEGDCWEQIAESGT